MKVLSLFSGIGGFDLGLQRAGMEIVGMCEINKPAQTVLRKRFPEAVLHDDVREVHYAPGSIDVICGGFPCQDVSIAGKRRGFNGERSGLWWEFARIIANTCPAWVIVENVPGLFSSNGGRDFAAVIGELAKLGYGVGWRVLDAQYWGLAQRRKRVFIIASFGTPRACTLLLDGASMRRDNPARRQSEPANTGTAIHHTPNDGGGVFSIDGSIIGRNERGNGLGISADGIGYTLTSTDRHAVGFTGQKTKMIYSNELSPTLDCSTVNNVFDIPTAFQTVSPTLRAESKGSLMSGGGMINTPLAIAPILWEASHTDIPARISANQQLAPTLTARSGTGGNNLPLIGVRRLTPVECERLQGFPDGWTDGQPDTQRYRQLGNAVAVPVAEWIGRRIMSKGV